MLSYRHAFHAGNHADVLKHIVLQQILVGLALKPKPFWIIDTHAGGGLYNLESASAQKGNEWATGIGCLWGRDDLMPAVRQLVESVERINKVARLRYYPGSPVLAAELLNKDSRMHLFELQANEAGLLAEHFKKNHSKQVRVNRSDGFAALKALLPPPTRRGLVLMDPSYETPADYRQTVMALNEGIKRFATGVYAIWYPLLAKPEMQRLPQQLKHVAGPKWANFVLTVKRPVVNGYGMFGSGMFVVNPPWTLEQTMRETLPQLVQLLAQDEAATFTVESAVV